MNLKANIQIILYTKISGEEIKHEPTAFKKLKETRETNHSKKIAPSISEVSHTQVMFACLFDKFFIKK